jgi:hypothetical protein
LNLLVQKPDARSTATLEDLQSAYIDTQNDEETSLESPEAPSFNPATVDIANFISHGPWPSSREEYLAASFDNGLKIVQVISLESDPTALCQVLSK